MVVALTRESELETAVEKGVAAIFTIVQFFFACVCVCECVCLFRHIVELH